MAICNNKKCSLGEGDQAETCTAYIPVVTNADHIRAMSDEELTDAWIRDNTICQRCAYRDGDECDEFVTNEKCREGILEWHKQPAEEVKE